MVSNRIKGKIVLVGSFLGYSSFVGYTNYAPGKYALRGEWGVLGSYLHLTLSPSLVLRLLPLTAWASQT